jgi:hypothetical protein
MSAHIRRHPLTQRSARSVAETLDDPRAWWEGPAEPHRLAGAMPWQPRPRRRARLGVTIAAVLLLLIGAAA